MDTVKKLRSGFTTGTCAAAAAKAAALMVFTGRREENITLTLPGDIKAAFKVERIHMEQVDIEKEKVSTPESSAITVQCAVRKFAGDDPDVTDGVVVFAKVCRMKWQSFLGIQGKSETLFFTSATEPQLYLTGGEGIGIVTKKGLACEPGFCAINPGPRKQIFEAVAESSHQRLSGEDEVLVIELSIPEGKQLAEKTFNPHLGIVGGISVLGTSGIVNPMSEQALLETIRLDIRVKSQEGRQLLAVSPGNYGEHFLREELGISMDSFVKCSNFIGETFLMMKEEGIERVLLAGHIGKLIKVAGGVLNTHSKYGDRRMDIFEECATASGVSPKLVENLIFMNTTEEVVDYLIEEDCLEQVMKTVLIRIQSVLERHSGISTEVIVFSSVHGILGETDRARDLIQILT